MAKRKRNKKGQFVKGGGGGSRRRRRKNPGSPGGGGGTRRRRRRRSSSRRRKNPSGGGGSRAITLRSVWPDLIPATAGKLWLSFAQLRFGGLLGNNQIPGGSNSPFMGNQWGFQSYLVGGLALWLGAKAMQRWRPKWAFPFWRGGMENMFARLIWTEVIGRSNWAQKTFGNYAQPYFDPNMGATVMDDARGNRAILTPQGWQYMMGGQAMGDVLTPARPMDGSLEAARPLDADPGQDDELEWATPLSGRRRRRRRRMSRKQRRALARRILLPGMGHFMEPGTEDKVARYHGSGANSSFHSAYQRAY